MPLRSEDDFLAVIDRHFPGESPHVELSRGDDCAVLRCPSRMCLSADLFLEDAHFRRSYFAPGDVGWKALAVNVSDIAAMGAKPLGFCLQLSWPKDLGEDWLDAMLAGMAACAREHSVALVGGDLAAADKLGLALTVWGEPGAAGRFVPRAGARPGDVVFLVGEAGLARTGLLALEADPARARADFPASVAAHLRPRPKVAEGLALASLPDVASLMDLSDGLARDLPRLLGPSLGAEIDLPEGGLHPEVVEHARMLGRKPVREAFRGGEDYALLGAVRPEAAGELTRLLPGARALGRVTDAPGALLLNGKQLDDPGFDHFS